MDKDRFEVVGPHHLWMRCDCGTWLLVQADEVFVGTIHNRQCHNKKCGARWVYDHEKRDWVKEKA